MQNKESFDNPFIVSERIIPRYFCDRKEESAQLIRLITNRNNVVLISQRRVGKTGLIQYCFDQEKIKKNHITFYVDILSTTNLQEFIFLLGKEIIDKIKPFGKKMTDKFIEVVKSLSGKIGYDMVSGMPTVNIQLGDVTDPIYSLKEIFSYLNSADKPCILAIDEFQQIARYPEKGVEALIRSHILQINNCRFIFSGSERHLLEQMFLSPSRPFYNSCSFIELHIIPRDIYVNFIMKQFKDKTKRISKNLAEEIYDLFEGLTFYIQYICNSVFEMTPRGNEATKEMFEKAISISLYSHDLMFRERLNQLSTRQKELLFAIAANGAVEHPTSVSFIKENSLASASAVQTALKALIKMEIIERVLDKYSISEKFFALWVKKNYT